MYYYRYILHVYVCLYLSILLFIHVCVCVCVCMKLLQLCLTFCDPVDCSLPGSCVHGSLRQEYWSGLPCPPPGDLPNPGIELKSPGSPALASGSSPIAPPGKPMCPFIIHLFICLISLLLSLNPSPPQSLPLFLPPSLPPFLPSSISFFLFSFLSFLPIHPFIQSPLYR